MPTDATTKPDWLPPLLRKLAVAVIAACLIAIVVGFLPGVEQRPAGGGWLIAMLAPVMVGALAVRRYPRPLVAGLWPLGAFWMLMAGVTAMFEVELFTPHRELWPAYVVNVLVALIGIVMVVLLVAMPAIVIARASALRRAERDAFPAARVV
jgi:hypothetical protein